MIYADNAATTKLDIDAFEAMKPYLLEQYGNASQPYTFSRSVKKALRQSREIIASCINVNPDEIYFTSGGTESDNWAIKGTSLVYGDTRPVLTSQIEHHAILNSCTAIERLGFPVAYLRVTEKGVILPDTLDKYITPQTKLVSIMLANNEIGTIQPISQLAAIAHKNGALFHTDAVQAVGHIQVDVQKLGVDMLSASAHKFNGPKGIGFLYVRKGVNIHPLNDGGTQESSMRAGTENVASIVGMTVALKKNCESIDVNTARLHELETLLITRLEQAQIEFIRNGDDNHIPGNISISIRGVEGEMLLHRLDLKGIYVSTGAACNSGSTQLSHVLSAINMPAEYAIGTIRISLGRDNTKEDVISISDALIEILKQHE